VGCGAHLLLGSASATDATDPPADAPPQRHRSVEHDAQDRLAALFPSRALMNVNDKYWTKTTASAKVAKVTMN
tara:strand:+ start:158 stop:376 length:219 start_codon:yes stop_codon:yes gene_type:complete